MENQEKSQKENQEHNQERSQEHNQNNGLELLKKVIETNERNTKPGYKLSEITNTLKIRDIKQKLQENNERTIIFNSTATEQSLS